MRFIKRLLKWFGYFLLIPVMYILVSLLLTSITVNSNTNTTNQVHTIYLASNGVHLDIIIPKKHINTALLSGLYYDNKDRYFSFGWGEENFYLNTPNWSDLSFRNAFNAAFLNSTTLMHVTRYQQMGSDWIKVPLSSHELDRLNTYIQNSFITDAKGQKIPLKHQGYSSHDDFYKSNGSYSCIRTCNTWVNSAFKQSGLKACLWTPFDFGLINKYQ